MLRIGQRPVRDDRATTHVALVARAFGARRIYMEEAGARVRDAVDGVNAEWGGGFEVVLVPSWRRALRERAASCKVAHLTMYGEPVGDVAARIAAEGDLLAVVGAGKVPREVYDAADYNVAVGGQPHSEVAALAVFLDRVQGGRQFGREFPGARRAVVPERRGKRVAYKEGINTGGRGRGSR